MSHLFFRNLLKTTHQLFWSAIPRNPNFHTLGIIPGGGLGKLQGIREEEYFSRLDHKLFENMKQFPIIQYGCLEDRSTDENKNLSECTCSVKHKNLLEEAYFLNDHCDCLKLLEAKSKNQKEH